MDLVSQIQLINTEGVGPVTFFKFINEYGSAQEALKHLPPKFKLFPKDKAQREIELAKHKGVKIISYLDNEYPENLKQLPDAPPLLYVLGNIELLQHPVSLSIVGARNASVNGRKTASRISYDLTNNDVLIISGMAKGIDAAAHKGAMYAKSQTGPTIAVLGTGVDVIYPLENKNLYEQIKVQGAIISEFPMGTEPQPNNFPRRNRIVSALSNGTLVAEATTKSGSLITARLANEQGKDVFAIPGSPLDARSSGPNQLIKEGAVLVESFEDIINHLAITNHKQIKSFVDKKPQPVRIEKKAKSEPVSDLETYLSHDGIDIDELIRVTGLDSSELSLKLLELELSGRIERQIGNKVALIGKR